MSTNEIPGLGWKLVIDYGDHISATRHETRSALIAYLRNNYTYEHLAGAGYTREQLDAMHEDEFYFTWMDHGVHTYMEDTTGQSLMDKMLDQARCYKPVPCFQALPLSGPGRWSEIPGGLLYTNDDNILFLQGNGTNAASDVFQAISKAYDAGESATDAFDRFRGEAPAVSGDLSGLRRR